MKRFKLTIIPVLLGILTAVPVFASNTNSISLNGSNQYLYVGNASAFQTGSAWTYEAAFKLNALPGASNKRIVGTKLTDNSVGAVEIVVGGNGDANHCGSNVIGFVTWSGSTSWKKLCSGITATTGQWYYVRVVKTANNDRKIYVTTSTTFGSAKATDTTSVTESSSAVAGIAIGADDEGSGGVYAYVNALIDEVKIWSNAHTTEDLGNELTGSETGLVAYWKLNNNLTDSAIAGTYGLTAVNSPSYSTDVPFVGGGGGGEGYTFSNYSASLNTFVNDYQHLIIWTGATLLIMGVVYVLYSSIMAVVKSRKRML